MSTLPYFFKGNNGKGMFSLPESSIHKTCFIWALLLVYLGSSIGGWDRVKGAETTAALFGHNIPNRLHLPVAASFMFSTSKKKGNKSLCPFSLYPNSSESYWNEDWGQKQAGRIITLLASPTSTIIPTKVSLASALSHQRPPLHLAFVGLLGGRGGEIWSDGMRNMWFVHNPKYSTLNSKVTEKVMTAPWNGNAVGIYRIRNQLSPLDLYFYL